MRLETTWGEAARRGGRKVFDRSLLSGFKRVAESAMDCAVAHWYMVPGLKFHRFRVSLGVKSLLGRKQLSPAALTMALHRTPRACSYLGFHFASRFLSGDSLGDYLDVSSPWLFPLAMLSSYHAVSATILSQEAPRLRNLLSAAKIPTEQDVRCEAGDIQLDDESYDTVTSLWSPEEAEHGARDIRNLWRVLRPGGTLLLSVPCTGAGADSEAENLNDEKSRQSERREIYDPRMLERDIFQVIGQPKRYAIYGAQRSASANEFSAGEDSDALPDSRDSLAIGRDWRCYANLQELVGPGVIVMKFTSPAHAACANGASFATGVAWGNTRLSFAFRDQQRDSSLPHIT